MTDAPTDEEAELIEERHVPDGTTLRVTVEDSDRFPDRTATKLDTVAQGETPDEHVRSFATVARLRELLTERRVELVETLLCTSPESISALAETLDRAVSDVHDDLQVLADAGIATLEREGRRVRPTVPYDRVRIDVTFERDDDFVRSPA